jgi:dTDP-4-amino-4,6-dideoxygalactose transaminase
MVVKLFHPYVSKRAIWNVVKVLWEGKQLAEGPLVKQFVHEFSTKFNKENVVALNSGTSALELAYELAGLQKGDEVITPVLTCTATNIPLVRRGCRIVFADIEPDLNIDIEDVKKKITKKTKAIVFVHFGGNNRGLIDLLKLCRKRGITLIEDAAQAIGSDVWGYGDYTCVSLQAIKTLTSGDGGFLVCKSKKDYDKAMRLKWFGYDREEKQKHGDTDLKEAGYKYHMNDITAAIGLGNLRSIDKIINHRNKLAKIYQSYGMFAHAWLAGGYTPQYDLFKAKMADAGYEVGQHHYRNDKYTLFKKYKSVCPMMHLVEKHYVFVPYHHKVTEEQAHDIGTLYKESI